MGYTYTRSVQRMCVCVCARVYQCALDHIGGEQIFDGFRNCILINCMPYLSRETLVEHN